MVSGVGGDLSRWLLLAASVVARQRFGGSSSASHARLWWLRLWTPWTRSTGGSGSGHISNAVRNNFNRVRGRVSATPVVQLLVSVGYTDITSLLSIKLPCR